MTGLVEPCERHRGPGSEVELEALPSSQSPDGHPSLLHSGRRHRKQPGDGWVSGSGPPPAAGLLPRATHRRTGSHEVSAEGKLGSGVAWKKVHVGGGEGSRWSQHPGWPGWSLRPAGPPCNGVTQISTGRVRTSCSSLPHALVP